MRAVDASPGTERRGRPVSSRPDRTPAAKTPKPPLRQRLRYRFDNSLARGPLVLIGWLGVVVLAIVVVAAVVGRFLLGATASGGFFENVWDSLLRVFDSGAFQSETAWPSRLVWFIVTLLGILIGGSLIGLIAAAIDRRVDDLRKGRSPVLETGHTLILGWSARLPVIVKELSVANESLTRPAIVILAPRDVADMAAELRDRVGDTKNTRVVCRSGNPWQPAHLQLVNIAAARSVIVLAGEHGDAAVVKTVLAVKTLDPDFSRANVVAEFAHPEHAADAPLDHAWRGRHRQLRRRHRPGDGPGVSPVRPLGRVPGAPRLRGPRVLFRRGPRPRRPHLRRGAPRLRPLLGDRPLHERRVRGAQPAPAHAVFEPGDQVIAVAEDDETLLFSGFRDVRIPEAASPERAAQAPMRVLIVGWSGFGPTVVRELDEFLAPGSLIEVSIDPSLADPYGLEETSLANTTLHVSLIEGGPEELRYLQDLRPFDQVIVLGYRDRLTIDDADSRTLLTLLTLREMWPVDATPRVRMIAQLLDQANAELANTTGVDDFIVSDALASLMLAQLSERAELQAVFDDLFDPNGRGRRAPTRPPLRARRAGAVRADRGRRRGPGVSVLGWRIDATGEVVVNPPKAAEVHLASDDQVLIVGLRAG